MQIVIDIDSESYEHIKAYKNEDVLPMGWYAISHGTPLTSGVTDMNVGNKNCILDKIRAEIEQERIGYPPSADYYKAIMKCLQIIDKYKEVDREYKESKWVKVEDELPELYREVWLSCRDYEVWLSCRGYKKVVRGYLSPDYHKSWYVYDSECGYYNINNANAWMYVERPKPYKAEKR